MKLSRATFLGIRGLPDVTFDLTSPDTGRPHPVVVLTGPPESGKTRALEAILAAKDVLAPTTSPQRTAKGGSAGAETPRRSSSPSRSTRSSSVDTACPSARSPR
ncbi:MAG: hypothetical protein IPM79_29285 [Polyangiaceae bacterium]|nr:hypothetical protein [Polyangiaceae bacterium]